MCGDQPQDHLNPLPDRLGPGSPTSWLVPASSNLGLLSHLPQNPAPYNSRTTPALGPWSLSHSYQNLALPANGPALTPGPLGRPGQQPCFPAPPTSRPTLELRYLTLQPPTPEPSPTHQWAITSLRPQVSTVSCLMMWSHPPPASSLLRPGASGAYKT